MPSRTVTDVTPSVWDPATGRIYTFLFPDATGTPRSAYGNETFEELRAAGSISPEAVILPFVDAYARQEAADRARYCTGPQRIDRERWDELLNVLPPCHWVRCDSTESFHISEAITGNLYTHCVRIGDKYFTLVEERPTRHSDLVRMCLEA
jgi:hypothetical protein